MSQQHQQPISLIDEDDTIINSASNRAVNMDDSEDDIILVPQHPSDTQDEIPTDIPPSGANISVEPADDEMENDPIVLTLNAERKAFQEALRAKSVNAKASRVPHDEEKAPSHAQSVSASQESANVALSGGARFLFQERDYSVQVYKISWHFNRVVYEMPGAEDFRHQSDSTHTPSRRRQSISTSTPSPPDHAPLYYSNVNTHLLYPPHLSANTAIFDTYSASSLKYSHYLYNTSPADNLQNATSSSRDMLHLVGGLNRNACGNYMDWSDKNMIAFSSMGYENVLQELNDRNAILAQQTSQHPNSTPNANLTPSSNPPPSSASSQNPSVPPSNAPAPNAPSQTADSSNPSPFDASTSTTTDVVSMCTKQILYLMDPNEPKFHTLFITNHTTPIKDVLYNATFSGGNDLLTYDDESVCVWSIPQTTGCANDLECQQFTKLSGIVSLKWMNYDFVHVNEPSTTPPKRPSTEQKPDAPVELQDKYEKRFQCVLGIPHGRSAWLALTRNGMAHLEYRVFMDLKGGTFVWKSSDLFLNSQFRVADIRCTNDGSILVAGSPPHSTLIHTYVLGVHPEPDMNYSLALRRVHTPFSIHNEAPSPLDPEASLNNHIIFLKFVPFRMKQPKLVVCSVFGEKAILQEFTLQADQMVIVSKAFKTQPKVTQTRWICTAQVSLDALPTCLRFSKDGDLLCVGYLDGRFELRRTLNLQDVVYENDSLRRRIMLEPREKRRKIDAENGINTKPGPIYSCSPINAIAFSPTSSMLAVADAECRIHFFTLPLYKPTDITPLVELSFINYHDPWDIFYLIKCWIVEGNAAEVRENMSKLYANRVSHRSSSSTSYGKLYERFTSIVARMMGGKDNLKSIHLQNDILFPLLLKNSTHLTQTLDSHRKQATPGTIPESSTYQIHRWISVYMYMWTVHWGYIFLLQWTDYFRHQHKDPKDKENRVSNLAQFYFLDETDVRYVERFVRMMQYHRADAMQVCKQNANLLYKIDPATKPLVNEGAIESLEHFLREYVQIQRRIKDSHSSRDIVRSEEQFAALRKAVQECLPKIKPLYDDIHDTVAQLLTLHMDLVPQLRGRLAVKDELTVMRSWQKDYLKDIFTKERMSKGISYKYCRLCSRATMPIQLLSSPLPAPYHHACPACGSYWFLS